MNILPIVARELRVNARRPATFSGRATMGAVCFVVGLGTAYATGRGAFNGRLGLALFTSVAGIVAMFAMFAGVGATADCISSEKREGTLGLLFLTHLKPYDIVLGKFVACSIVAFYAIMAAFPILALGLLLGGVQFVQVGHMAAALLNTLFFSATLGVFTSCLSRRPDRAGAAATCGAVFFWVGVSGLAHLLNHYNVLPALALGLRLTSPQAAFEMALGSTAPSTTVHFWPTILTSHALGWLFLVASCFMLPWLWQDRAGRGRGLPWSQRMAQRRLGRPDRRANHRRWALDINPYFWLATREFKKPRLPWYFLGFVAAVVATLLIVFGVAIDRTAVGVTAIGAMHLVVRLWIISEATHQMSEERQTGTLELILSTPLPVRDIQRGHWMAMRRMFAGPLVVIILLDVVLFSLVPWSRQGKPDPADFALLLTGAIIILVLDSIAMIWQGLWAGVSERRPQAVGGNVVVRVLFLPLFALFLIMMLAGLILGGRFSPSGSLMGGLWFSLSVANAIFWLVRARRMVTSRFRLKAMERFLPEEDRTGFWKRLRGRLNAWGTRFLEWP